MFSKFFENVNKAAHELAENAREIISVAQENHLSAIELEAELLATARDFQTEESIAVLVGEWSKRIEAQDVGGNITPPLMTSGSLGEDSPNRTERRTQKSFQKQLYKLERPDGRLELSFKQVLLRSAALETLLQTINRIRGLRAYFD
eukprot:Trichotokara_eunicae@DN9700_c0_g1_i1.p1